MTYLTIYVVENFLVNKETLEIKIIDFDLAQKVDNSKGSYNIEASIYSPPEIINDEKYSVQEVQVWQLGIVLYILLFNEHPFRSFNEILKLDIRSHLIQNSFLFNRKFDISFIASMLSKDPRGRPSMDVIQYYFKKYEFI